MRVRGTVLAVWGHHRGWLRPLALIAGLAALAQAPLLIGAPGRALALPLEPLALALLLLAVPPGRLAWLSWPAAAVLTLAWCVLAMERTAFTLLGRPLKLWLDLQLIQPALELISGAMGASLAALAGAALLALPLAVFWAFRRLAGGLLLARAPRLGMAGAAVALTGMAAQPQAPSLTSHLLSDALAFQVERTLRIAAERRDFAVDLADDPLSGVSTAAGAGGLEGLQGVDVVVVFVESYGRAALTDPRYAPRLRRTLRDLEEDLTARGLTQASGWLASPTIGGQSWLAHASLSSGLWVDSQDRWDLLVTSERTQLTEVFADAGYASALMMPAIVKAWPEAAFFGFDRTYFQTDMGYSGPPYAWVTMPDQYTLAALDRQVLAGADRRPVYAQVALISSHAPWTPIPPVLPDWDAIGDGAVFEAWSEPPIPPSRLWLDGEAVRDAYVAAVDYVLRSLGAWLQRPWDRPRLVLILGDHEAGAVVSAPAGAADAERRVESVVPLHVISDRPQVAMRLLQAGLAPGLLPPAPVPDRLPPRMSDFRDLFLEAYGVPGRLPPLAGTVGAP